MEKIYNDDGTFNMEALERELRTYEAKPKRGKIMDNMSGKSVEKQIHLRVGGYYPRYDCIITWRQYGDVLAIEQAWPTGMTSTGTITYPDKSLNTEESLEIWKYFFGE